MKWMDFLTPAKSVDFKETLALLFSRYMFRNWVQGKLSTKINAINAGTQLVKIDPLGPPIQILK